MTKPRCSKVKAYSSEEEAWNGLRRRNAQIIKENLPSKLLTKVHECPLHNCPTWHTSTSITIVTGGRRKRR